MKSCDEMVASLLARREQYVKKKRRTLACAATVCGVCLVALVGIGLWQKGQPPASVSIPTGESEPTPVTKDRITVQTVEELPGDTGRMNITLMMDHFVPMTRDEVNGYYGVNIFPTVPEDLTEREGAFGIFQRDDGEIYWDSNDIDYRNGDESRWVHVGVDKEGVPFDFCNLFDEPDSKSVINDTEVGIAQTPVGDLYAEFLYENVGFRIVTTGLTRDELVAIVASLIR